MDARSIRTLTIAVWALAAVILIGLAFVSAQPAPTALRASEPGSALVAADGKALPVAYEFSTDT